MKKEHQIRDVFKVGESIPLVLPINKYNWKITSLFQKRFFKLTLTYTSLFTGNPGLARLRATIIIERVLESFNLKNHTPISLAVVKDFRPSLYRLCKRMELLELDINLMQEAGVEEKTVELFKLKRLLCLKEFKNLVNDLSLVEPILKDIRTGVTL